MAVFRRLRKWLELIKNWLKNKVYLKAPFQCGLKTQRCIATKQQTSIKGEKLRDNDCDRLDHVVFRSFLYQRSHNIPIDDDFIKGKAFQFAKKLSFNELQASDGWLCRWE